MHADEYAYEFGEDLDLFMKYTIEESGLNYTKEDFLREFNESLGAAQVINKFKSGKSVNYNDLVDWVIV